MEKMDTMEQLDNLVVRVYGYNQTDQGAGPLAVFRVGSIESIHGSDAVLVNFTQLGSCSRSDRVGWAEVQCGTSRVRVELNSEKSPFKTEEFIVKLGGSLTLKPMEARSNMMSEALARIVSKTRAGGTGYVLRAKRPRHCIVCGGSEMCDIPAPRDKPDNSYAVQCTNCEAIEYVKES